MTPAETAQLLAMAAAFDGRMRLTNTAEIQIQAQAWAAALDERMPLADAKQILIDHYASSSTVIMPADINTAWWRQRRQIMATYTDPLPQADPDDVEAWLAELRANRARHNYRPEQYGTTVAPQGEIAPAVADYINTHTGRNRA